MYVHRCPECGIDLVPMYDTLAEPMVAWRCDRCRCLWDPYEPGKYRPVYWPDQDRRAYYGMREAQGLPVPERKIIIARR